MYRQIDMIPGLPEEVIKASDIIRGSDPLQFRYVVATSYKRAQTGKWQSALDACERIKAREGSRESANRLGVRLFRAQLLRLTGRRVEALPQLRSTPFYLPPLRCFHSRFPTHPLSGKLFATTEKKQFVGLE